MADAVTPRDRANKAHSLVLQKMPHGTAQDIAKAMEVSDSELSGIKNKQLEPVLLLLAHLDLKVVSTDYVCLSRKTYEFLTEQHERMVKRKLAWVEDEE